MVFTRKKSIVSLCKQTLEPWFIAVTLYKKIGAASAPQHQKGELFFPFWRHGAGAAPLVTELPCIR